jgi:hypothetical protein
MTRFGRTVIALHTKYCRAWMLPVAWGIFAVSAVLQVYLVFR